MINLKKSIEEKKEEVHESGMMCGQAEYPYGLSITLEPDVVKKLGITSPPTVGDEKMILAKVICKEVTLEEKYDDTAGFSVRLQMTDMEVRSEDPRKEEPGTSSKLYGGES